MKIKALKAFTHVDDGELLSIAHGKVIEVDDTLAQDFIADGLAEQYRLVEPTGTKSITANGSGIDVAQYATADVDVPAPAPALGEMVTIEASETLGDFGFVLRIDGVFIAETFADTGGTSIAAGSEIFINTNGSATGTYKIGDAEALPMTSVEHGLTFTIPASTPAATVVVVDGNF